MPPAIRRSPPPPSGALPGAPPSGGAAFQSAVRAHFRVTSAGVAVGRSGGPAHASSVLPISQWFGHGTRKRTLPGTRIVSPVRLGIRSRRTTSRIQVGTPETHGTSLSFSARHPNTKSLPASETAVASEPVAVSFLQGSRWFAPLDATPSLHSCPRGQARSGLHWRGGGNIGRSRGISARLHRVGAWTSTRQRADSVVRPSQGLFCGHWLE